MKVFGVNIYNHSVNNNVNSLKNKTYSTNFLGKSKPDTFEFLSNTKANYDKSGDLKSVTEYKNGNIYRQGKMIENEYGIKKLEVKYPKSDNNLKELYVTDKHRSFSYKLSREQRHDGSYLITHYIMPYKKDMKSIPDATKQEKRLDVVIDNKKQIKSVTLYNNDKPFYTIDLFRDKKGRVEYEKMTVFNNKNESKINYEKFIKYDKSKTIYSTVTPYCDEHVIENNDGSIYRFVTKKTDGIIKDTVMKYKPYEFLKYEEFDKFRDPVLIAEGDVETKELKKYKKYKDNNLIEEAEKYRFNSYIVTEYNNDNSIKNKFETEDVDDIFNKNMFEIPNEKETLSDVLYCYNINEIYPAKNMFK